MGGVFEEYGNVTTTAEFNIFVDPHAAQEVFQFGVPIQIAPLDVTHQVVLTGERLQAPKLKIGRIKCRDSSGTLHNPAWNFIVNT